MGSSTPKDVDLVLERAVPISAEQLFRGYAEAEILKQWFTPHPWITSEAEIDPVPGGIFRTVMNGPDGERNEGTGCVLEVVKNRRFVWTSALEPGFRPVPSPDEGFLFTAIMDFEPTANGAIYRATARHMTAADAKTHAEMGFEQGWGAALDQLVALFS